MDAKVKAMKTIQLIAYRGMEIIIDNLGYLGAVKWLMKNERPSLLIIVAEILEENFKDKLEELEIAEGGGE